MKDSAIQGSALAVLILLVFLRSISSTMIIGIAIPVSVITTFALMYFNGITLNTISFGGLALGVGMLVDNAIVVLENIFRHRENGMGMFQAAVKGSSEVAGAITSRLPLSRPSRYSFRSFSRPGFRPSLSGNWQSSFLSRCCVRLPSP